MSYMIISLNFKTLKKYVKNTIKDVKFHPAFNFSVYNSFAMCKPLCRPLTGTCRYAFYLLFPLFTL